MRRLLIALVLSAASVPVIAPTVARADDACAQTEAWFNTAVDSRKMGESQAAVVKTLAADMGKDAAEQLATFVFALPDAQLTREVGAQARKQCEGL